MKSCRIFYFLVIFFIRFCCSSYVFTQEDGKVYVCKTAMKAKSCSEGPIFTEPGIRNLEMNLGFLNLPSEIFHDGYDMAKFGFPIFYEYFLYEEKLKVNFIIANGKKSANGEGEYYYVSFVDETPVCKNTKLWNLKDTLSGALYLNQKYAKYAYFVYHTSASSTCTLSFKFEDLFQGNYGTKNLVSIQAEAIYSMLSNVENYIHPFFTVDSIFGTVVYLVKNGNDLDAVHYKIDESNLQGFKKAFSFPLSFAPEHVDYANRFIEIFRNPETMFDYSQMYPSFKSYGKSVSLFFMMDSTQWKFWIIPQRTQQRIIAFWPSSYQYKETIQDSADLQRHLYYLDSNSFINGEPDGKSFPKEETECPENYFGWFITFAIIDFLFILALLCLGLLIFLGSKKMKKLRKKNHGRGNQSVHGETTFAAVTGTTVAGGTTIAAGQTTVAPTNLNTQFTKATTVGGRTGATTNVTVNGKQQQTTTTQAAGSAPVGTTARKTTILQTWESKMK